MLKKTIFVLAVLALAATAFAHGDMEHVLGTVTSITDHSLTVKTPKGEMMEVEVDKTTKVVQSERSISLSDIRVGDRVVIHARKHDAKLMAAEVRLAPQGAAQAHH